MLVRFGRAAIILVVAALLTMTSCADSPPRSPRSETTKGAATKASFTADTATRKRAQAALTLAESLLWGAGSGHYDVVYKLAGARVSTTGDFSLDEHVADYTYTVPGEPGQASEVRVIQIGSESYGRVTADGESQQCWYHFSGGSSEEAEALAVTPPVLMLLEPKARGFAKGGTGKDVVMDVLLDETTSAAFPRAANLIADRIPVDASIPARVRLDAEGGYESLVFRLADVLDALDEAGIDLFAEGLPRDAIQPMRREQVRIDYSQFGTSFDIEAPPPKLVAEMDGGGSNEDVKPCTATG